MNPTLVTSCLLEQWQVAAILKLDEHCQFHVEDWNGDRPAEKALQAEIERLRSAVQLHWIILITQQEHVELMKW